MTLALKVVPDNPETIFRYGIKSGRPKIIRNKKPVNEQRDSLGKAEAP
jgi:hypothetical protein